MQWGKLFRLKALFVGLVVLVPSFALTGCGSSMSSLQSVNSVKLVEAKIPTDKIYIGVGERIDYEDENLVLFHGYFGIYLYSLKEKKLLMALDFKQFNGYVQGSNPVFVKMGKDLQHIFISPLEGTAYKYNIKTKLAVKIQKLNFADTFNTTYQGRIWGDDGITTRADVLFYEIGDVKVYPLRTAKA